MDYWPDSERTIRVIILTVDPRTRQVEGRMKDGVPITLAVWETPSFFRWPREGEEWTALYKNNVWRLGEWIGTSGIENLMPGEARISADKVYVDGSIYVLDKAVVLDDDDRLGDVRAPTGVAGGVLSGTYPNPGFALDMATQAELDAGLSSTSTALTNHTSLTTTAHGGIVASNDSRLTDSRTPTGPAGGILAGTYPDPSFAVDMATQSELDASNASSSAALATHAGLTTTAHGGIVASTDPRLTDSRTPTGNAGGDLAGTYPDPTIKSAVNLSGAPTTTTAAVDTNTTQIATTGFVLAQASADLPLMDGVATTGTSTRFARQGHIHPSDTSRATQSSFDSHTAQTTGAHNLASLLGDKADLVGGLVPTSQIPARALVTVNTVTTQAAQLALTAEQGDIAIRTDEHKSYVHNGGTSGTMADWTVLDTPLDAVTSVNGQIGTVVLGKADIGLANVDNTSDANKPISTAAQTALDLKAPLESPALTGVPAAPTAVAGTNTTQIATTAFVTAAIDSDLLDIGALTPSNDDIIQRKAGVWTNRTPAQFKVDLTLVKADVGLANADDTSDVNKPVSTATQTALDLKAPLASPTFTGIALGPQFRAQGTAASSPRFFWNVTDNGVDQKKWQALANTTLLKFSAVNDVEGSETSWLEVTRGAGTAISGITFPNGSVAFNVGPTAPTAAVDTNTTQIATTAFIHNAIRRGVFSAYHSSAITTTAATWTKGRFQTEEFDPSGWFDSTTNWRYQPLVAGYYRLNAGWNTSGNMADGSTIAISIYKNGISYKILGYSVGSTNSQGVAITSLVQANGSSDYFEVYWYSTNAQGTSADSRYSYFQGELIAPS